MQALKFDSHVLFEDYIGWIKVVFQNRDIPAEYLEENILILQNYLTHRFGLEKAQDSVALLDKGMDKLTEGITTSSCFFNQSSETSLVKDYTEYLLKGETRSANQLIIDALDKGMSIEDVYLNIFQYSQYEIGRLWQINKISVAQEHFCTAATQKIMAQLYPSVLSDKVHKHSIIATCVGNELHEMGIRMVADFFEMNGWNTSYFGASTPSDSVLKFLKENHTDVILLSATLTPHLSFLYDLIQLIKRYQPDNKLRIIVGGYPFNLDKELWTKMGADGYAADAKEAVSIGNKLVDAT